MAGLKKGKAAPFTRLTSMAVAQQEARAQAVWDAMEFDFTLHDMRFVRELNSPTFDIDGVEFEVDSSSELMMLIRHVCRTAGSNKFTVES